MLYVFIPSDSEKIVRIFDLNSSLFAFESFKKIESMLKLKSYSVLRTPLEWFNGLEIKAKGHPLFKNLKIIEYSPGTEILKKCRRKTK